MWTDDHDRLALLELWSKRRLHRRALQAAAWDELDKLAWTRRTTRRDELVLDELHRHDLEAMLDRCFAGWRDVSTELERRGLPVDLHGWKRLQEELREATLPNSLPERMNQRTAAAALAEHSKATLSQRLRAALGDVEITKDGIIRLRPNQGVALTRDNETIDAVWLASYLGEVVLTERALTRGTRLAGVLPRALLLVENVGFYIDVPVPEGWMVAQVPGWNTATVRLLLAQLPNVPVVHFGDLDPNGLRILAHLQEARPDIRWAVPAFWEEYIATCGQSARWPDGLDVTGAPSLVQRLVSTDTWLEQERLALDPRIVAYLQSLLDPGV